MSVMEDDKQRLADYAALLARHNALKEAVAWEMECEAVQLPDAYYHYPDRRRKRIKAGHTELRFLRDCARAEVDRLIANGSAADCEGEG